MDQPNKRTAVTLRDTEAPLKWAILLLVSLAFIVPLELMHLPAALLLGAMAAAILVAVFDGKLAVPHWPYVLAQGLIGCLVARSIGPAILSTMAQQWPLFLAGVCSVLLVSTSLGALLARWKVLPGTTAVWGSSPGAATVMVLMSEGFGGDPRLVAYMQFLRVMLVALAASIVARLWVAPAASRGCDRLVSGGRCRVHVGNDGARRVWCDRRRQIQNPGLRALLVPLFARRCALLHPGQATITLPPWLMGGWLALIGSVDRPAVLVREIVVYAARVFQRFSPRL